MICRNCGAYFIRYPCPTCGLTEKEDVEMRMEAETAVQVEIHEEPLLKPSELRGNSAITKLKEVKEVQEILVKPSEMSLDKLVTSEDFRDVGEEKLVKPSELRGGSAVNPKILPKQVTPKVVITHANQNLTPMRESPSKIGQLNNTKLGKPVRRQGETEEEYKIRVRDTLLEVMTLLEKLVED